MTDARVPAAVWRGTGLLVLGRLFGTACSAAVLLLLARRLPTPEFGLVTFYLALFALAESLTDLGTGALAVQRSADDPARLGPALAAGRRIRAATALFSTLAIAGTALLWSGDASPFLLLAALYPLARPLELSSVAFQREIAWTAPVLARATGPLLRLAGTLLLLARGVESGGPYVLVHALGLVLANLIVHLAALPRLAHLPRTAAPEPGFLRAALPLGIAALCQQAYFWTDNLFVRVLEGDRELGLYNAGVRLLSFLVMIAAFATTTALPWLTRRARAGALGEATARIGAPLVLPASALFGALWPWSGALLRGLYGPGFEAGAPALRWLIAAAAVVYAGAGWLTALLASGRTRAVLGVTAGALVLNVLGNAWLVPALGIEGAAVATFATELCVALASLALLARAGARPWSASWFAAPLVFVACALASNVFA